ncbi:type VI secretion system Vgr family protein [Ideonella sp. YS5]|uniref:type VI secretion system Vgr family protein n=1 Tax=Ideonella sp. YS5 TaxID=3453714 RepID=UPI003EEA93F8
MDALLLPTLPSPAGLAAQAMSRLGLAPHDQATRLIRLHTPLGAELLLAEDLNTWEAVLPQAGPGVAALAGRLGQATSACRWSAASAHFVHSGALAGTRVVLHALCADATLDPQSLIGLPALVELLCQDAGLRPWHGHIAAAAWLGADGGFARLRLVVEPWLAWLAQGQDARLHQDLTVPQLIDTVFSRRSGQALPNEASLAPAWRWALSDPDAYPQRSLCAQAHESDLAFVLRLMREEGLVAWWEHAADAASPTLGGHTLVIADHASALPASEQATVRFTASDHTLGEDSLTQLADTRRAAASRIALTSRDYRSGDASALEHRPVGALMQSLAGTDDASPDAPDHVLVDHPGAYAYPSLAHGQQRAEVQAQRQQAAAMRSVARGPWRRAQAGTWFTLAGHPRHGFGLGIDPAASPGEFVVLAAQHRARNNLAADERARVWALDQVLVQALATADGTGDAVALAALHGDPSRHPDADERLHEAALLLQPLDAPLRLAPEAGAGNDLFVHHASDAFGQPDARVDNAAPASAAATALVVGAGEPVHTDRDGRIRIQQHWQRGADASHRLTHPDGTDDAPAGPASHTWARVGQWVAGANWGSVFTPRVGQEVVLTHLGGRLDRPLVLGALYNGSGTPDAQGNDIAAGAAGASGNAPAWFPGTERPDAEDSVEGHAHDAVLSGWRSQSLGTSAHGLGGCNQLVFDASPGQARLELGSYADPGEPTARLQLGHLRHQEGNQRLAPRGHGLDLASPDHGAMRAGAGLLLSAHARSASTSTGQQLDSREPQQDLQTARDLQQALATTAQQHNARLGTEPAVASGSATQLSAQLPVQCGLHALNASLQGVACSDGSASSDASDGFTPIDGGHGSVAAWSRPDLVLAAPSGVQLATPANAILAAGTHCSTTAAQDINLVAQASHALAARDGLVLFTYGQASNPSKPLTETGLALHAACGSVHLSLNSGAADIAADQSAELVSTSANLAALSPESLQLAASGAAIEIQSGSIDLKAPSPIEVHAGMKNWTGATANVTPQLTLPSAMHVEAPQDRLEFQPYKIYLSAGPVKQVGVLNAQTLRVYTSTAERIRCEIGTGDWDVEEEGYNESDVDQIQDSLVPV